VLLRILPACVKVLFTGLNGRMRRQNAFDKRFALIPFLELLADMVVVEIMLQNYSSPTWWKDYLYGYKYLFKKIFVQFLILLSQLLWLKPFEHNYN